MAMALHDVNDIHTGEVERLRHEGEADNSLRLTTISGIARATSAAKVAISKKQLIDQMEH
jgi:hypothetical protein